MNIRSITIASGTCRPCGAAVRVRRDWTMLPHRTAAGAECCASNTIAHIKLEIDIDQTGRVDR